MADMKINYVSIKGYEETHGGMKLCLRGAGQRAAPVLEQVVQEDLAFP